MADDDNGSKDLNFETTEWQFDPFSGTLQFTVQQKIRITNFEFCTHDLGCRRTSGRDVKYGLRLMLDGKIHFMYHRNQVEVPIEKKNLILTPGNTYKLDSWLGGHAALKPGEAFTRCFYNYAGISRSDQADYAPFVFVFADDEEEDEYDLNDGEKLSNKTCIWSITYEMID